MMVTIHVGYSGMSDRDVCDIIVVKISRFLREDLTILIIILRDELISVLDERLRILRAELEVGRP